MSRKLPVAEAEGLLRSELQAGQQTLAHLSAEQAWLRFVHFGKQLFDTPKTPDADGLLFQYGVDSYDGPPAFTLDLTRQFEVIDGDGEHDHYVQLGCELRYALSPELRALTHCTSWFFHDADEGLDQWAEEVPGVTAALERRDDAPRRVTRCEAKTSYVTGFAAGVTWPRKRTTNGWPGTASKRRWSLPVVKPEAASGSSWPVGSRPVADCRA